MQGKYPVEFEQRVEAICQKIGVSTPSLRQAILAYSLVLTDVEKKYDERKNKQATFDMSFDAFSLTLDENAMPRFRLDLPVETKLGHVRCNWHLIEGLRL